MADTEFVITHDDLEQIVPGQEEAAFLHHGAGGEMSVDYGPLAPPSAHQVSPEDPSWCNDSPQQVRKCILLDVIIKVI